MFVIGSQPYAAIAASGVNQGVDIPFRALDAQNRMGYLDLAREREERYAQQYDFERQQQAMQQQAAMDEQRRKAVMLDSELELGAEWWQKGRLSDKEWRVFQRRNAMGVSQIGGVAELMEKREAARAKGQGNYAQMADALGDQAKMIDQQAKDAIDPLSKSPTARSRALSNEASAIRDQQLDLLRRQDFEQFGRRWHPSQSQESNFMRADAARRAQMRQDNPHIDFGPVTPEEMRAMGGAGAVGRGADDMARAAEIVSQVKREMQGADIAAMRAEAERRLRAAGINP